MKTIGSEVACDGYPGRVRRPFLTAVAAAAMTVGVTACAADPGANQSAPKVKTSEMAAKLNAPKTTARADKRVLTGSHIPTTARRIGTTADTPYPIHIIDAQEIARSGAGTVSEALRRCPAVR